MKESLKKKKDFLNKNLWKVLLFSFGFGTIKEKEKEFFCYDF